MSVFEVSYLYPLGLGLRMALPWSIYVLEVDEDIRVRAHLDTTGIFFTWWREEESAMSLQTITCSTMEGKSTPQRLIDLSRTMQ